MRSLRARWQRLRDVIEGNMRQRITRTGVVYVAIAAVVGIAAFVSANNLLFLVFSAFLSSMLISGLVSRLGLAGLELHLNVPPHIAARMPIQGQLIVHNRKFFTPSFALLLTGSEDSGLRDTIAFPVLPARKAVERPVQLFFARRGIHKDNTFWFESSFPFGITNRRARVRLNREVLVYPAVHGRAEFEDILEAIGGEMEGRQRGRGTEFYRVRPYEGGESARNIDWKASAHTGKLQVREFSEEQNLAVTLCLDLKAAGHSEWFETAVECCAFLVWRLHDRGTRFRFLTQRYDRRVPEEAHVYDVLEHLALVEPMLEARLPHPDDHDFSLAVTLRPEEAARLGWTGVAVEPRA